MPIGTLILRADASVRMGTGHAMRCLALAQAWQDEGGHCIFAMAEVTPSVAGRLQAEGMEVVGLTASPGSAQDAAELTGLARTRDTSWVVVDGYQFDVEYQRALKAARLKMLAVDDIGQAGTYLADLVLDQNANACESVYRRREPYTRLLLGPRYAMLRREFKPWRQWKREIPAVAQRLLVTVGGSDPDGLTFRVIEALTEICPSSLAITVVAGGSSQHLAQLRSAAGTGRAPIDLLCDPSDMPALMARSEMAIICAGGTLWELLYMGCAILSYARNQTQGDIIAELSARGAVCNLGLTDGFDASRLATVLSELADSLDCREKMARLGREMVDGDGTRRTVQQLLAGDLP